MPNTHPKIFIYKDSAALSSAAAEIFLESAKEAIQARGHFTVALSGGGTPGELYTLLAVVPYRNQGPWGKTFVFWADERLVPPDEDGSNYRQAMYAFLNKVPIPTENILRIKGELESHNAAIDYTQTLKRFASPPFEWPRFDLALLGMGADGHMASLFPGSPVAITEPVLSVTENYQGRPANRVTLTAPVFNSARQVVFLVTGESKSETLSRVINGEHRPFDLPAQRIQPTDGTLTWLLDRAAASNL